MTCLVGPRSVSQGRWPEPGRVVLPQRRLFVGAVDRGAAELPLFGGVTMHRHIVGVLALTLVVGAESRAQHISAQPAQAPLPTCGVPGSPLLIIDGVVQPSTCDPVAPRRASAFSCNAGAGPLLVVDGVVQPSSCDGAKRVESQPSSCPSGRDPLLIIDGVVQQAICGAGKQLQRPSCDASAPVYVIDGLVTCVKPVPNDSD